jgi:hypothetical protein
MKVIKPILSSAITSFLSATIVFAQTATPTATTTATTQTKGGLPEAGVLTPTVIIVTVASVLIISGLVKIFKSFR